MINLMTDYLTVKKLNLFVIAMAACAEQSPNLVLKAAMTPRLGYAA
jgi:hypothetical protein